MIVVDFWGGGRRVSAGGARYEAALDLFSASYRPDWPGWKISRDK
jgi:hypothetical protein